jgi:hypothetical protein
MFKLNKKMVNFTPYIKQDVPNQTIVQPITHNAIDRIRQRVESKEQTTTIDKIKKQTEDLLFGNTYKSLFTTQNREPDKAEQFD